MKKLLAVMFLAAAMVSPAFAIMEFDVKVGYIVEPSMVQTGSEEYKLSYSQEPSYSIGADVYLYLLHNIGIGAGVNYILDSKFTKGDWQKDAKLGSTNAFVAVKPILAEDGLVDRVYLLGQLGMGITKYSDNVNDYDFSKNGLYWGVGFGIEKWSILVELLYSVNYWENGEDGWDDDYTYTNRRLAINLGYKFGGI